MPRPPGAPLPWEYIKPPAERVHAVPIAYVGSDIEGNLAPLYVRDRGIKGAFWANFLSAAYVAMCGGEAALKTKLTGMRVEPLAARRPAGGRHRQPSCRKTPMPHASGSGGSTRRSSLRSFRANRRQK